MIAVDAAIALIRARATPLPAETVALDAAHGRVLAADVFAPMPLPAFANSAMDGYALRAGADGVVVAGAELEVAGEQVAGDPRIQARGQAWGIMTGARMPDGFDGVLPVEQAQVLARGADGRATRIRVLADVPAGQHLRRAGEDIAAGELAAAAGRRLDATAAMLLRGAGVRQVAVARRPRIAVLNTGRELVAVACAPDSGEILDTNGPYLQAALEDAGAEVVLRERLGDDPADFQAALRRARDAGVDVVVSTGAVSMGRHDFIPDALAAQGAELGFHTLRMRPGKPLLFARLAGGALYFGLPGNPVSSVVGQRFFVQAALRRMLGQVDEQPLQLPLASPVRKKPGFTVFHKAAAACDDGARLRVRSLPGQESFRLRPLLEANAWLQLPEAAEDLPAGAPVAAWPLSATGGWRLQGA